MAQKGSVSFCIGGHPVLRGRIKPEGIKILEQDVEPETSTDVLSSVPKAEQETTDHLWTSETEGVAPDPLDAPLHLSVEIGRVKMPLKKLLSLESGSILDIIPDIDQSVDLVLNGRSVAKGELLHLGHLAGVRILDLHG
jgi:flagellar motor switch protein FliN/FliY